MTLLVSFARKADYKNGKKDGIPVPEESTTV